jgi:hyperosmotically inducible periplasmic protein
MKNLKTTSFLMALVAVLFTACGPKDADLQKAVSEKLKSSPELATAMVEVKDGVATLTGEAQNDAAKAQGETLAKEVKGVKSVVNNLTVTPPPAPEPVVEVTPDDPMKQGLMDATKDFAGVKAEVTDGVVTLTGDIKKSDLPKLMQSISSLKPKKIDNKLTVK